MGYFDGIVDGSFKTMEDGVLLFYPFGVLGKGYAIPSNEKKQEIRIRLKRFYAVSLILLTVSGSCAVPSLFILSTPWWIIGITCITIVLGLFIISYLAAKRFTKGLTPVGNKLTIAESYQNSAKSHNIFTLVAFEIMFLLFIVANVWMIFDSHLVWYLRLSGLLIVLFCGFGSLVIGYMIKVKIQK